MIKTPPKTAEMLKTAQKSALETIGNFLINGLAFLLAGFLLLVTAYYFLMSDQIYRGLLFLETFKHRLNCRQELAIILPSNSTYNFGEIKIEVEKPDLEKKMLPYTIYTTFNSIKTETCVIRSKKPFKVKFSVRNQFVFEKDYEFISTSSDERLEKRDGKINFRPEKFFPRRFDEDSPAFLNLAYNKNFNGIHVFNFRAKNIEIYPKIDDYAIKNQEGIYGNWEKNEVILVMPDLQVIYPEKNNSFVVSPNTILDASTVDKNRLKIRMDIGRDFQSYPGSPETKYCTSYPSRCFVSERGLETTWLEYYLVQKSGEWKSE